MRTPDDRRDALQRGADSESAVARALEARGWSVLDRNWRGGGGELDLVVVRDGALRFVEVKAREPGDPSALESITRSKQARLASAAEAWLQEHGGGFTELCFLVAVVSFEVGGWTIDWYDDAFDVG